MGYTNTEVLEAIKTIINNVELLEDSLDVAIKATKIEEQNKRYRDAINDYLDLDGDYKEIVDKAERIFRRALEDEE